MFGLFDLMPKTQERMEKARAREIKARLKHAQPWDPKVKFETHLAFQADTYKPLSLFDVEPLHDMDVQKATAGQLVVSPNGKWAYCEKILPAGVPLATAYGRKRGDVVLDGPVLLPALHAWRDYTDRWDRQPWMSLTPSEIFTLRTGTRFAKGHTIVAGLGLGHQLIEVSHRKQVSYLTLVERDRELVNWLMPRIRAHLGREVDVLVGNAYDIIPAMEADAALIDIYPGYGGNTFPRCPRIRKVWVWGSQYAENRGYGYW